MTSKLMLKLLADACVCLVGVPNAGHNMLLCVSTADTVQLPVPPQHRLVRLGLGCVRSYDAEHFCWCCARCGERARMYHDLGECRCALASTVQE
jgi:hypothetical protein